MHVATNALAGGEDVGECRHRHDDSDVATFFILVPAQSRGRIRPPRGKWKGGACGIATNGNAMPCA